MESGVSNMAGLLALLLNQLMLDEYESMYSSIPYFWFYHTREHYFFQKHFLYSNWMMGHYLVTFGVVAEAKRHLFLLCI